MNSRHSTDEICHDSDAHRQADTVSAKGLFAPGFVNIVLCYISTCTVLLVPLALLFSASYANHEEEKLFSHYYYIRTTIALMVIGSCSGGIMVILGADFSTNLILAGLLLIFLTGMLAIARCMKGIAFALMRRSPSSYRSYIL